MEILGYVGFAILLFQAATWTIGVRVKLDAGIEVISGALFFVVAALFIGIFGANKLHSLWVIPTGYLFSFFVGWLAFHVPPAFQVFRYLASAFAIIVRVGIPEERIKAAQYADMKAQIDAFASKTEK